MSDQANAAFAYEVATAGDVNGDGCATSSSALSSSTTAQNDEGRACVYQG